jgi:hypothetical protein
MKSTGLRTRSTNESLASPGRGGIVSHLRIGAGAFSLAPAFYSRWWPHLVSEVVDARVKICEAVNRLAQFLKIDPSLPEIRVGEQDGAKGY